MQKNTETRTAAKTSNAKSNKTGRKPRAESDARMLARIRTAAAIVRHRQEALYDRLADRFRIAFEHGTEMGRDAMHEAAETAREQLTAAGALTPARGERLKNLLLRDLDRTAEEMLAARASAAEPINPALLDTGALASLAIVLESAGNGLVDFVDLNEHSPVYSTGEVISAGTLTCEKCKTTLLFKNTGTVPPCPTCSTTRFQKSY